MGPFTLNSLELRWFMAGRAPGSVVDWFTRGGSLGEFERRVDSYWCIAREDVGVKRRNGGPVEMKLRRSSRPHTVSSGCDVTTEQWNKWVPRSLRFGANDGEWVDVEKVLLTRTFTECRIEVPDQASPPIARCEVELASLLLADEEWWTFALEATGPASQQPSLLFGSLETLWSQPLVDAIAEGRNLAYPGWLACRRRGPIHAELDQ